MKRVLFACIVSALLADENTTIGAEIAFNAKNQDSTDSLQNRAIVRLIYDYKMLKREIENLKKQIKRSETSSLRTTNGGIYTVVTYGANVRKEPSLTSKIVRHFRKGDLVHILYCKNRWCKVANGGYMKDFLLKPFTKNPP